MFIETNLPLKLNFLSQKIVKPKLLTGLINVKKIIKYCFKYHTHSYHLYHT